MERKLATVLFVDLVGSTALVAASDPEIVRRRVTRFFDQVAHCITVHGGIVEKFAGDAVLAAFGIPQAHEDDAERAVRAALGILDAVHQLGLEARLGLEAGEVVADESDSTFATGEAVNLAARLQQAADPGQILVGPGARRLTYGRIDAEEVGALALRGRAEPLRAWRVLGTSPRPRPRPRAATPFVARDDELELLAASQSRAQRARRAHLFTIFGEPGVGKSRLAREFTTSLDGATVLSGRCLPYGEGVTYWPLAEMVKAAAGISDDEPSAQAEAKLRVCCEDDAVADLLALAAGVLDALDSDRSQQEIAWAVREWAEQLSGEQPLVLVFEDIHWAEEPLLDLVEHLAEWVREAPLLLLCLARPELLDRRPGWGGGRLRATAIELDPLARDETEVLLDALLEDEALPGEVRETLLEKTEGNPLFLEETVRMLGEADGASLDRIPDTLQALIAARIDLLPPAEKAVLQRAAVIGRVFWGGALAALAPELECADCALEGLLLRDFVLREQRSTISAERAYRFKHVLIREVAYAGLAKEARAEHHSRFAEWLRERAGEELVEIRAYHLDQAAALLAELDGEPPARLAQEAAEALETAGRRALAREAHGAARKLFLRAAELGPTLERRYLAGRAAWRLHDLPAVGFEMERVRAEAREAGERELEGAAVTALADVALLREGDLPRALLLVEEALAILPEEARPGRRFEALRMRAQIAVWVGDLTEQERHVREGLALAQRAGRKDLESLATHSLAGIHLQRLDVAGAEPLVARALELAEESGGVMPRASAALAHAKLQFARGELSESEQAAEQALELFNEAGAATMQAGTLNWLSLSARTRGELPRAERLLRDAIRILTPLGDRGTLCESQRDLAQLLLRLGRLDEAERLALASRETVGPYDVTSRATTTMALGLVRAAQGRDLEAEELLREAVGLVAETEAVKAQIEPLKALRQFLDERGRSDEAAALEERLAELESPSAAVSAARIA